MRRSTHLLLASGMLAACGTQSTEPTDSSSDAALGAARAMTSVAHHLDVAEPLDSAAGDMPAGPAGPYGRNGGHPETGVTPAATAADAVLQFLEDEGLLVLNLDSSMTVDDEGSAVVLVRVLFGTDRSYPQEVTYLVRLAEDAGSWPVLDLQVAP